MCSCTYGHPIYHDNILIMSDEVLCASGKYCKLQVLFDTGIIDTDALSYRQHSPVSVLDSGAIEKKRAYQLAVEDSSGNFTPFFSQLMVSYNTKLPILSNIFLPVWLPSKRNIFWGSCICASKTLVSFNEVCKSMFEEIESSRGVALDLKMVLLLNLSSSDWTYCFHFLIVLGIVRMCVLSVICCAFVGVVVVVGWLKIIT